MRHLRYDVSPAIPDQYGLKVDRFIASFDSLRIVVDNLASEEL